jgi:hypothetical protein
VLPGLAGISPRAYDHPAEFSTGFHHAMLICAGLCALGGVLAALLVGRRPIRTVEAVRAEDPAALQRHCAITGPHARPAVTTGCREVSVGAGRQPVGEAGPPESGARAG